MAGIKVCPHCGSVMFAAKIISPGAVQSMEDGTFKIVSEKKDKQVVEIAMCARCRRPVTEDELVSGIPCKECGKVVSPSDIDANGICDVCKAKKERADLANASTEDLIKMIINMEKAAKGLGPVTVPVVGPADATEEVLPATTKEAVPIENSADSTPEFEGESDTPSGNDGKKSRAKRRARRDTNEDAPQADEDTDKVSASSDDTDTATEEPAIDVKSEVNVNDLASLQEAPFPDPIVEDLTGTTNVDVPMASAHDGDVAGVNNFAMFDASNESF